MESRKRPLPDEEELTVNKKRILTGINGSPHVNGFVDIEDEAFGEKLELYRKEAIYRRMKHYSKEFERSKARIYELEQRKTTCEAGLAAMSACWAQLIDTIRLIVKPDDLPQVTLQSVEIFDLTASVEFEPLPQFATALGNTVNATQALVTKFVQLGDSNQSLLLKSDDFPERQKVQNECVVLRSQISILREKLQDSNAEKEKLRSALIISENRLERSRSATVREVESKAKSADENIKKEDKEESQRKGSPAPSPTSISPSPIHSNGIHDASEREILQEQIKVRDAKIMELEHEGALLRDQKTMIELEHKAPTLEQIHENGYYKALRSHASQLEAVVAEKTDHISRLQDEVTQLYSLKSEWEESAASVAEQAVQEYKSMVSKRDGDIARLREQREQQNAELVERRGRDISKYSALQEYKSLLDSNSERINILQSELSRCKAQIAANAGAHDLMTFFHGGNTDEVQFFENLKLRNIHAENRVAALEETFSKYQNDHSDVAIHMNAEAEAHEKLLQVTAELESYRKIYGDLSSISPDVSDLIEKIRLNDAELEKLRLLDVQRQESESSLYAELEKLSALWESLDRQLKSKVFDLSNMEERLTKSGIDKAKSDNKFFAIMREKEAIELEKKNLVRTLEKQEKAIDRYAEVEKSLKNQISTLEKQLATQKKGRELLKDKLCVLEKDNPELILQLEGEKKRLQELNTLFTEREAYILSKRNDLRAKEDDFIRYKKELEKQILQAKRELKPIPNTKVDPADVEVSHLRALAYCTTCHENFRSTIITKCMHTFCKDCLEARLATRQRKCPFCSIPFGQSDVHPFFFQ